MADFYAPAQQVACPVCGAAAEEPCTSLANVTLHGGWHPARIEASKLDRSADETAPPANLNTALWSMSAYLRQREFERTSGKEGVSTHQRMTQPEADLIADWFTEISDARDAYEKRIRDLEQANAGLVEQIEKHKAYEAGRQR